MPVPFSVNIRASDHKSLRSKLQTKYPKNSCVLIRPTNTFKRAFYARLKVLCLGAENIQNRHPERCRF